MMEVVQTAMELSNTYAQVAQQMVETKAMTMRALDLMNQFVAYDQGIAGAASHFEDSAQKYDRLASVLQDAAARMQKWAQARAEAEARLHMGLGGTTSGG
jgi:hypothetical protein